MALSRCSSSRPPRHWPPPLRSQRPRACLLSPPPMGLKLKLKHRSRRCTPPYQARPPLPHPLLHVIMQEVEILSRRLRSSRAQALWGMGVRIRCRRLQTMDWTLSAWRSLRTCHRRCARPSVRDWMRGRLRASLQTCSRACRTYGSTLAMAGIGCHGRFSAVLVVRSCLYMFRYITRYIVYRDCTTNAGPAVVEGYSVAFIKWNLSWRP